MKHLPSNWSLHRVAIATAHVLAFKKAIPPKYMAHYQMAIHHLRLETQRAASVDEYSAPALCLQSGHTLRHGHFDRVYFTNTQRQGLLRKREGTRCSPIA